MISEIIYERFKRVAVVTLNRPQVLNALNLEMIEELSTILESVENDPEIELFCIEGAGGRAFCAGGDIKAARLAAIEARVNPSAMEGPLTFFAAEYELNKKLFHFSKPTLSIMNGVTMGGGVGLANACRYRVATEKTIWGMPEVAIGFFPDVGAAYYLSHIGGHIGEYLALTGEAIKNPADLIEMGLATHFINSADQEKLLHNLAEGGDAADIFKAGKLPEAALPYEAISEVFSKNSVEDILETLLSSDVSWQIATAETIIRNSPTSLKVTLRHVRTAKCEDFNEIIARDLKLAGKFLWQDDMIEGIRAAVVDKDKAPRWSPQSLKSVSDEQVESFFN